MDHRSLKVWLKNEDLCLKKSNMLPKPCTEFQASNIWTWISGPPPPQLRRIPYSPDKGARGCRHGWPSCYPCHIIRASSENTDVLVTFGFLTSVKQLCHRPPTLTFCYDKIMCLHTYLLDVKVHKIKTVSYSILCFCNWINAYKLFV